MIDQYIYTRLDGAGANKGFGHDIASSTEGIVGETLTEVKKISRYKGSTVDGTGAPVKIFEKRRLADMGKAAFQQSVLMNPRPPMAQIPDGDSRLLYYSSTNRAQFLSHGYVCDMYDEVGSLVDVDRWFCAPYVDFNVNLRPVQLAQQVRLTGSPTPLLPLQTVLAQNDLTIDLFVMAVRAVFDASSNDTTVFFARDFTDPEAFEKSAQLLRWIYHFLPLPVRRYADFTTCYDSSCSGRDFAVVMVDEKSLSTDRTGRTVFRTSMPTSARYGYIFANGAVAHQTLSGTEDFDTSNSLGALWLNHVIRKVYEMPHEEACEALKQLDQQYFQLDVFTRTQPGRDQSRTDYFNAFYWLLVCEPGQREAAEEEGHLRVFLGLADKSVLGPYADKLLKTFCRLIGTGLRLELLQWLQQLKEQVGPHPDMTQVADIYLARLLDSGSLAADKSLLNQYFVAAEAGGFCVDRLETLERVCFATGHWNPQYWALAGTNCTDALCNQRLKAWVDTVFSGSTDCRVYLTDTRDVLRMMGCFTADHFAAAMQGNLLPCFPGTEVSFQNLRYLLECRDELMQEYAQSQTVCAQIELFYSLQNDILLGEPISRNLSRLLGAPERVLDILDELNSALMPVGQDDVFKLNQYLTSLIYETWYRVACEQKIAANRAAKTADPIPLTYLPNTPDIFARASSAIRAGMENGQSEEVMLKCYILACEYVISKSYSHRSMRWYSECDGHYDKTIVYFRGRSHAPMDEMRYVCRFIKKQTFTYGAIVECLNGWGRALREGAALQRAILELVERNELPQIDSLLLFYCYLKCAKAEKCSPADYLPVALRELVRRKTARGLMEVLNLLDSAPVKTLSNEQAEENNGLGKLFKKRPPQLTPAEQAYRPRPARISWIRLSPEFVSAMRQVITEEKAALQEQMKLDNFIVDSLILQISALLPPVSALAQEGRELNRLVYSYWDELRIANPEVKEKLKELKKKDLF